MRVGSNNVRTFANKQPMDRREKVDVASQIKNIISTKMTSLVDRSATEIEKNKIINTVRLVLETIQDNVNDQGVVISTLESARNNNIDQQFFAILMSHEIKSLFESIYVDVQFYIRLAKICHVMQCFLLQVSPLYEDISKFWVGFID